MQQWIVGIAVVLAAVYAVWSFTPERWRQRLANRLGWQRAASTGGCHSCDECGSCQAPAGQSDPPPKRG
ncbi:hypothetical protein [Ottowia thiooxydans]|uniref:hypothetical protein n=1 Tax=Ottowia thiooxydans TaxID=219182 RepID=UPI0004083EBF|nr:hypothetical protein [Ottowia thiooxydans]